MRLEPLKNVAMQGGKPFPTEPYYAGTAKEEMAQPTKHGAFFSGSIIMKISAIIVNHNCSFLTRLCIEALQHGTGDMSVEIIVVDNNSSDESLSYLKKLHGEKRILLIQLDQNKGYGQANNIGAKYANGEYLLILNPDVVVEKNTVAQMVEFMRKDAKIGLVGPQLYFYNGNIQDSCRRFMSPLDLIIKRTSLKRWRIFRKRYDRYIMKDFDHSKIQNVDIVTGACILVTKSLFNKLNGFDPRFFLFMEDIDLCRRVWDAGFRVVYFPHARALHYHKRLSEGGFIKLLMSRIFWVHVSSAIKYFYKWRKSFLPNDVDTI